MNQGIGLVHLFMWELCLSLLIKGVLLKKGLEKAKKRTDYDAFNDKWYIDKM